MLLLHTADLHLGRQFNGNSLAEDHANVLEQIYQTVVSEKPDALVIAGDVYDRTAPPEAAVALFHDFLQRMVSDTATAIIIIAGNHDSGVRLASLGLAADRRRWLVRGPLVASEAPLVLEDRHGKVAFSGLPFGSEYAAQACFGDTSISTPEHVLTRQVAAAKEKVPKGARWVVAAHAFVAGAAQSESERPLVRVGGIETVPTTVFDECHYVALGHLHRPQTVTHSHICYSGSPLPFSFSEDHDKSMQLVEMDGAGGVIARALPFSVKRRARTVTGTLADVMALPPSDDFIRAVLTDTVKPLDPMKRLQTVFPNACDLEFIADRAPILSTAGRATRLDDPFTVVREFIAYSRNSPLSEVEDRLVSDALGTLTGAEAA